MHNPYWKNICAIAGRQRAKGIATYCQGIEMNPADVITRIEYLQEELVDALMYCEWIKGGIRGTGNWIPVTERLPDKWRETDEEYFGEPIEFIVHICGAKCATTLCFDGTEFFDMTTGEIYPVSHWMPLPEPPKEG